MNPLKGETPLSCPNGGEYTLVLDYRALIAAEAHYGQPLAVVIAHGMAGFQGAKAALLLAAMKRYHPATTEDQALALVFEHGEAVGAALEQATERAFPAAEDGDEANPPEKSPRGKNGGASGASSGSTPTRSSKRPRAPSR